MLFLGLDLAWGAKNTSGGCALRWMGDGPATVAGHEDVLGDDDDILAWVEHWDSIAGGGGLLLGVDAPLLVPNWAGKRPCEAEIGRRFARFQAGAHPANRTLFRDDVRGERLAARLAESGIAHDPYLDVPCMEGVRRVMEVFPHPAHVVLFGLSKTLKYKAKTGRDYPSRWAAMNDYSRLLRGLMAHDPPLGLDAAWPPADVSGQIAGTLKRTEDGMDALTCAYITLWYWWHGAAGAEVIGDTTAGYIVVPRQPG